jgi:hypothetical protein
LLRSQSLLIVGNSADAIQKDTLTDDSLRADLFVNGVSYQTGMAFLNDIGILVLQKNDGTVRIVENGILLPNPGLYKHKQ